MNGILLLNKSKGLTSQEELDNLKKIIHEKRIGHTGTLDPIATGLLVVLLGKYTKLSEELTSLTKEYIAEVKVGIETDSLDITGNTLKEEKQVINKEEVKNVINSYKKTYDQEVPYFSSVRVEGKHLYEYARDGVLIKLPKRSVTIYDIELLEVNDDSFKFRCVVSKGTYIRSLIRDILKDLNLIGTMSSLERVKQGIFDIKDSYTLEDIKNNNYKLVDLEYVFKNNDKFNINLDNKKYIMSGNLLDRPSEKEYFFYYENDELKVIYKVYDKDNTKIKPILFV